MFKLKRLVIKKFLSIIDMEVDLSKPGLYLITGYNDRGGDSNGSGKSSILAAIAMALWGRTPSGLRSSDVTTWGEDEFFIELTLDGPGGDYVIKRSSSTLEFSIGGKKSGGRRTDIQELINETFNSNYEIFFASTHFTSEMSDYITKMGDVDKKKLFKSIIGLEKIDIAYTKAKVKAESLTKEASTTETQIAMTEDYVDARSKELDLLRSQSSKHELTKQEAIEKLTTQNSLAPVPDEALIFETRAFEVRLRKEQEKKESIDKRQSMLEDTMKSAYEKLGGVKESIITLEETLQEAKSLTNEAICTKCGGKIGQKYEEYVEELQEKLKKAKREEVALFENIHQIGEEQQTIEKYYESLNKLKETIEFYYSRLDEEKQREEDWKRLNESIQDKISDIKNEVNPFTEMLEVGEEDLKQRQYILQTLRDAFSSMTHKIDVMSYMKILFSREGVAAHLIELAFGRLTSLGNRYLSRICTEGLNVFIVPQRELKSKAYREEIDIYLTSHLSENKIQFAALSGGQKQRVNIALLLALYKYCKDLGKNSFGFIILDEVLDLSLADKGQADVIALLRNLLHSDLDQIIVVSHKDELSKDFDYEIQLRRGLDGITRRV